MKDFKKKKELIVLDIIRNYHYNEWVRVTHNRNIYDIPSHMQQIYYRFGYLSIIPALSEKDEEEQIKELKKIRKQLKTIFRNMKRRKKHEAHIRISKI